MNLYAKAFLFDLNGTVIDDMRYHAEAWYDILTKDLNSTITRPEVKAQMYGKNDELLVRVFGEGYFTQEQMNHLSMEKERRYQQAYLPQLALIDGLQQFLEGAKQSGIKMAIGSAAIPFNIAFVLDNLQLNDFFPVLVSADDVVTSKPHPDTFLQCAAALNVSPADCIVFEDAPKGVEAAQNAGMQCVVLTTTHSIEEFSAYNNIIAYANDYTGFKVGNS
ncbi:beta-phosphoglucomutase family hydrolase [soil metagenome]